MIAKKINKNKIFNDADNSLFEGTMNKKLSCRKETVRLPRGSVLAKDNCQTIFFGHYRPRFIFNHSDVIGLRLSIIEFYKITQNNG